MDIEAKILDLEYRVAALEKRAVASMAAVVSGRPAPWDLSARQPCPAPRIASTVANVLGALRLQGWNRFPEEGDLSKALAYGVTEEMLIEHFRVLLAKYATPSEAAQAGHGANLRLHKTSYDSLIDGRGIGYTSWSSTPEEQRALYGYSQADLDALSAQHPERYIEDYWDYVESNGERGWRPRQKDAFGSYL